MAQSRFEPRYFELELKNGSQFPPLKVPTEEGTVTIGGKIDRVDLAELHGETYVRIVDYKTGSKEFKLTDVLYGMNLQMLIYLAALIENGGLQGAGILYMPAVQPLVPADRQTPPDKIQKEAEKKLKMNGLVLDDPEVITAMEEKATARSPFVICRHSAPEETLAFPLIQYSSSIPSCQWASTLDICQCAPAPERGAPDKTSRWKITGKEGSV